MAKIRTFIAVELPTEVRSAAARLAKSLAEAPVEARWTEPDNLHWTLQFLGDVTVNETPRICQAVAKAVANLPRFELHALGAGAFPKIERPRTLWLGAQEGRDQMIALHDQIEESMSALGFRSEGRRFRPHITLGRLRHVDAGLDTLIELLRSHVEFDAGRMDVREVAIFSSELRRTGPIYTRLGTAKLAGS
jgi:2'-5' RNA ligase